MSAIKSLEELEELPEKSVVVDRDEDAWQLRGEDLWYIAGAEEEPVSPVELFESWGPLHLMQAVDGAR